MLVAAVINPGYLIPWIIGTSANYSGEPPSISGEKVAKNFLSPIDLILDGGKTKTKVPTTILDCTSEELRLLRIGVVKEEEIEEFIESNKD